MPAEVELTVPLPGLSPVCGKPVVARLDGGRLSSDGGILLLADLERRLGSSGVRVDSVFQHRVSFPEVLDGQFGRSFAHTLDDGIRTATRTIAGERNHDAPEFSERSQRRA